jgi:hypothetical protein
VRAYTDSVDGDLTADVDAVFEEAGEDEARVRNLVASLAGVAGHAVMVIAARLEADLGVSDDLERRLERLAQQRTNVLDECGESLRQFRPAAITLPVAPSREAPEVERRSGLERRVGSNRRHLAPQNPSEKISLRLFGERRVGLTDRRSGTDRRLREPAKQ